MTSVIPRYTISCLLCYAAIALIIVALSGCSSVEKPYNVDEALLAHGWKREKVAYNPGGPDFEKDTAMASAYKKNMQKEEDRKNKTAAKNLQNNAVTGVSKDVIKINVGKTMINRWGVDLASLKGARYIRMESIADEEVVISDKSSVSAAGGEKLVVKSQPTSSTKKDGNNKATTVVGTDSGILFAFKKKIAHEPKVDSDHKKARLWAKSADDNIFHHNKKEYNDFAHVKSRYAKTIALKDESLIEKEPSATVAVNIDDYLVPVPTLKVSIVAAKLYEMHTFNVMEVGNEKMEATYAMFRVYPIHLVENTKRPKLFSIVKQNQNKYH